MDLPTKSNLVKYGAEEDSNRLMGMNERMNEQRLYINGVQYPVDCTIVEYSVDLSILIAYW